MIDSNIGDFGYIGYDFLKEVYSNRDLKSIVRRCVENQSFFSVLNKDNITTTDSDIISRLDFNISNKLISFIWDNIIFNYDSSNDDSFEFKNNCLRVINSYCMFDMLKSFESVGKLRPVLNYEYNEWYISFVERYSPILMTALVFFNGDTSKSKWMAGELILTAYETLKNHLDSDEYIVEEVNEMLSKNDYCAIHDRFLDFLKDSNEETRSIIRKDKEYYIFSLEKFISYMNLIKITDDNKIRDILVHWLKLGILFKNGRTGLQVSIKNKEDS